MENCNLPLEVTNMTEDAMRTDLGKNFKNSCSLIVNQFVDEAKLIEKNLQESKDRCQIAEDRVYDAKNYNDAWYKLGSTRKKVRLLAEAQAEQAKAVTSLQQGQALLFKFQTTLAKFCKICLQVAMKNTNYINELTMICTAIEERQQREDIPEYAINPIKDLHIQADEKKRDLEIKEQNEKNKKKYIGIAAIIVLIIVFWLMVR